tara:strand:- start:599 stop:865 length:267 start_codon:yes stop_codon:yes gene_type:complete
MPSVPTAWIMAICLGRSGVVSAWPLDVRAKAQKVVRKQNLIPDMLTGIELVTSMSCMLPLVLKKKSAEPLMCRLERVTPLTVIRAVKG